MTPEAAAWVYEHVILGYHDANERNWWCDPDQSDDRLICACQLACTWCRNGHHKRCQQRVQRQQAASQRAHDTDPYADSTPRRPWRPLGHSPETHLRAPASWHPGRKRPLYVAVWLADRVCRYLCTCTVCSQPAASAPTPAAAAPAVALAVPAAVGQLDLFEVVNV